MGIDDAGDVAGDVLRVRHWAHILDLGPRVDHAGVHEHEPGRMVDRPNEPRAIARPRRGALPRGARESRADPTAGGVFRRALSGLERKTPYHDGGPVPASPRWPGS